MRALLHELALDGVITFGSTMRPGPLLYLSGYVATNGSACLWLDAGSATLLTDQPWDVEVARAQSWLGHDAVHATEAMGSELAELIGAAERVGVIGWDILPAPVADALRGVDGRRVELVDIGADAARLRMVKTPAELALIREACTITSTGAAALARETRAGISERELAAAIEAAMRMAGSGPLAFPLVLGAGATQTASGVPLPGDRLLEQGDLVLLDCGGTYRGYCGDMARALVVGDPDGEQTRLLDTALSIFERCAELLAPGTPASEIHRMATTTAKDAGFQLPFLLGHGIGCQNWEPPLLSESDETELEPGMVITLEPGLYVPGLGGARLENTFLITKTGAEALTTGPIKLWES